MIGYLKGEVLECNEGRALLAITSPDGSSALGYSVTVPQSPDYLSIHVGGRAEFYIYTHVREDALDLYGFKTRAEKELFLTLLTVNGIGPKLALCILSGAEAADLVQAILNGDRDFLTRIPGVGKKTAERIVLELADSLRKKAEAGILAELRIGKKTTAAERRTELSGGAGLVRDAREALVGLGYREAEVMPLLNRVLGEMEPPPVRAEELIRSALKQLG